MNGRISDSPTPEGRLAAVVISRLKETKEEDLYKLDYADFEEALRPFLQRELIHVRIEEVKKMRTEQRDDQVLREAELYQELATVELVISQAQPEKKKRAEKR